MWGTAVFLEGENFIEHEGTRALHFLIWSGTGKRCNEIQGILVNQAMHSATSQKTSFYNFKLLSFRGIGCPRLRPKDAHIFCGVSPNRSGPSGGLQRSSSS